LDDIVNVGSTIKHAADCVMACGAKEVKLFALARRTVTPRAVEVACVFDAPLDDAAYQETVAAVPEALLALSKPYDLVFPTMPCRLNVPFRNTGQVVAWLEDRFGVENVHLICRQAGTFGLGRVTVDLDSGETPASGNYKLRLYLDEAARLCNIVSFSIPPRLCSKQTFESDTARLLWERLEGSLAGVPDGACLLAPGEARCLALLFTYSLDVGLRALQETGIGDVVSLRTPSEYDEGDAALLFGPAALPDFESPRRVVQVIDQISEKADCTPTGCSPFLKWFGGDLKKLVRQRVGGGDAFACFTSFFDVMAEFVGASNPESYKPGEWPYPLTQVKRNPYLRLRVGPTFDDLVEIMQTLVEPRGDSGQPVEKGISSMRRTVSTLLDFAIDAGAVVPTIARYDDHYFRIYRKGENGPRDKAQSRVLYAWSSSGRAMSLTECSKINTIIAFAADYEQVLAPSALVRGNVATLQESFLDIEAAEITHYLRDTGKLEEVSAD
jgi:hypothetical protein